ncbi:unnamed protein product [Bursaphelenchus xylophilus]|uniref:(pine wood nematode) hypothetical protein n=1 Tax=Bursaphelenchus xylophilus TaxID=6326 RepID=A0A1I7S061_BURXY|nr:unnamed protein product [Bursaphelenchus xylophilus]CAG9108992.1 unnamed protein product [Bursaphelenchus xylophilus]
MNYLEIYQYSDLIASILGLVLNVVLLIGLFKTNKNGFHAYSYLLLVPCANDIFFSTYQLLVQHLIKVDGGIIYIFPLGFEKYVPQKYLCITAFLHLFSITNTFTTQPAIYHYRYVIVSKIGSGPTVSVLVRNLIISVIAALAVGMAFGASIHQTIYWGRDYYIQKLSPLWFDENGQTAFMYAANWADKSTKAYFVIVIIVFSAANMLSMYFIWISVKSVHAETSSVSETTKQLRAQFTKTLISQTIVLTFFALIPCTIYMMALMFQTGGEFLGIIVLGPVSWFSCLNGLLPMYFVRAIRVFVLGLLGIKTRGPKSIQSTVEKSNVTSSNLDVA